MPKIIENKKYYRTSEVCRAVGISKTTLFRWFKEGIYGEAKRRDIRGWRLFTKEEIDSLIFQVNQINENGQFILKKNPHIKNPDKEKDKWRP